MYFGNAARGVQTQPVSQLALHRPGAHKGLPVIDTEPCVKKINTQTPKVYMGNFPVNTNKGVTLKGGP